MRFFFASEVSGGAGTTFFATPSYLELRTASVEPPGTSYLYVLAGPVPYSVSVAACWGAELDSWWPLLTDAERSADWIRFFSDTYPMVGRLWDAAARDDFGRTSLVREIDPDDMLYKWFVMRSVGNVSVPEEVSEESVRTFLSAPRLIEAYRSVLDDSFTAAREIATRNPSLATMARMFGKEFYRSQVKALELASEWAPRLTSIFGAR